MRRRWRRVVYVAVALLIGGPLGVLGTALLVAWWLPPPDVQPPVRPSNLILDRQGRLLYEWIDPNGAKARPVPLEAIAPACVQATLAVEDARFFQHPGVDVVAIARSVYRSLRYGQPLTGASTLTQQLVRITLLSPEERYERSVMRKLKEVWLAWRLERHLSKEAILTLYLNRVYYGNFAVGIEAAAHAYFGRSARELDLAQCALLAGLPQAPTVWNPLVNPTAARTRQRLVLRRMLAEGYISEEAYQRAVAEPLAFAASPFPIAAPHFVNVVQATLEREVGIDRLQEGGWVITTTLDLDVQQELERVLVRHLHRLNRDPQAPPGRRVTAAAAVVLDVQSGEVIALVGSPNYFDVVNAGAVNMALTLRQPGSAIKPLVYAAAFDPKLPRPWGPATLIADERTRFTAADGTLYVPENVDRRWHGVIPARVALAASLNVPAVKALQHAGLERFLALADALGVTSLARHSNPDLALALGAGEVSLLELTRAYAAFARGGQRVRTRWVKAVSYQGQPVPGPWTQSPSPEPALPPGVAYLITDVLSDRYARTLTFGLNSALDFSPHAAVKTGTTTDWRDAWTVGYTTRWAVGVWVGNWDNTPMKGVTGALAAAPIWRAMMAFLHRQAPPSPFPKPAGIRVVRVCATTGLPPTPECPRVREDLALQGVAFLPREPAVIQRRVTGAALDSATPVPTPAQVRLLSPDPGAVYRLDRQAPTAEQALPLAVAAPPGSQVLFLVNGTTIGRRSAPPYRVWWPIRPGEHRIRVRVRLPEGETVNLSANITVLAP